MQILFVCPHGAAKSVMADAITRDLAARKGLPIRSASAGTEPDAELSAIAVEALTRHGLVPGTERPRLVEFAAVGAADIVVTFGCEAPNPTSQPVVDWGDVPDASQDVEKLFGILEVRVGQLVDSLTTPRN